MEDFEKYMTGVYEQLACNVSDEWVEKNPYNVFPYSDDDVKNNINYFKECYDAGLSGYKALTFFDMYLKKEYKANYLVYKDERIELRYMDIVQLTSGMYVGVCHPQIFNELYKNKMLNSPILVTTTPFSSIHSTIYIEHIDHVVEHFDNINSFCSWFYENSELVKNNPLFINLERNENKFC